MKKVRLVCKNCKTIHKTYAEISELLDGCCSIDCKVKRLMRIEKEKLESEYWKLPQETKQTFLDLIHNGKSICEAKDELNLSLDLACEILNKNIEQIHYLRSDAR